VAASGESNPLDLRQPVEERFHTDVLRFVFGAVDEKRRAGDVVKAVDNGPMLQRARDSEL
jgi:hypothetical protein